MLISCFQHHLLKRLSFPHQMVLVPLLKISWSYMRRFISGLFIYLNGWGKIKTIIFCDMCRFYEICISVSIEKCSVAVHPGWFFCIIYGCFCIIAAELNSCDRLHSPANPRIFTIWSFILFFFLKIFLMWTIFKVFGEFVTILLLF